jgi:hypothetical protein
MPKVAGIDVGSAFTKAVVVSDAAGAAAVVGRGAVRTGVDLATVIAEIEGRAERERGMIDEQEARLAWAQGAALPLADAIREALDGERAIAALEAQESAAGAAGSGAGAAGSGAGATGPGPTVDRA